MAVLLLTVVPLAVPFEEDAKAKDVWFLDHDYLNNMFNMFRKVNGAQPCSSCLSPHCSTVLVCSQGAGCGLVPHRAQAEV